jgi:predicted DNA-binding transcriptional regulator AlpA
MPLLNQAAVAAILGVKPRTLEDWRLRGTGPDYIRISSRCVRYNPFAVAAWAARREVAPASETAAA